jgi:catecholate siderophore receptor
VTFRQSATDADNHVVADVGALYALSRLELTSRWQAIGGLRYERFALRLHNERDGRTLRRTDRLLSPRGGLVFKPAEPVSLYGSYGVSFLPSAGDQFSSLTPTTQTLEPERFDNYEVGAKWEIAGRMELAAAAYRLDRTNTTARDPLDPARLVQTGSQRTRGFELGLTGEATDRWQIAAAATAQRATIVSRTTSAAAGATVPLVPHTTLSLWNRYRLTRQLAAGAGVIHQTRMYTAIDNSVTLPAFTRYDAALYVGLGAGIAAQLNVENLLDAGYFATAHGNNNIMPGAPRTLRLSLTAGF